MTFVKGKSGNPSGRPKVVLADGKSLADLAREHTQDAIDTLVRVCTSIEAPEAAQVAAANAILDRGWGKPKQEMDLNVKEDRAEIIAQARERVHGVSTQH